MCTQPLIVCKESFIHTNVLAFEVAGLAKQADNVTIIFNKKCAS